MAVCASARSEEWPVVDWLDDCLERLISGESLNVVGLDGSGRSTSLKRIASSLDPDDWITLSWSVHDLKSMSRREVRAAVDGLSDPNRIPVLLIDDFGQNLLTDDGPWLERMLFSKVHESSDDSRPSLRCVVATHPRDREIVGPGSALRERCRQLAPAAGEFTEDTLADFGCVHSDELVALTGGNAHLLAPGGRTPEERRGVIRPVAQRHVPRWVGQLDQSHQARLATILKRPSPARWRVEDADPVLSPLVVRSTTNSGSVCLAPECIDTGEVQTLLVGEPWPRFSVDASARRMAARCGNEPSPIWVDNYLSDFSQLDSVALVRLLAVWIDLLPTLDHVRILSRNWVGGERVYASTIVQSLEDAGMTDEIGSRIEWRIYDQRNSVNLHRRELLLPRRGTAFTLPPAQIIVGQTDPGNETDAATPLVSSSATSAAWNDAVKVLP